MKHLAILLTVVVVLAGSLGSGEAVPIAFPTNTVDFSGTGTDGTHTYLQIGNNSSSFTYSYTHTFGVLDPAAISLVSASLALTHNGNSNNSGETWFSYSGGNLLIGQLSASSGTTWTTNTWNLSAAILAEMSSTNPWTLGVKLTENTTGTDNIKLDTSVLSGTYEPVPLVIEELFDFEVDPILDQNPVPEPATLSLLGIGLAGLVSRRKKQV